MNNKNTPLYRPRGTRISAELLAHANIVVNTNPHLHDLLLRAIERISYMDSDMAEMEKDIVWLNRDLDASFQEIDRLTNGEKGVRQIRADIMLAAREKHRA